VIVTPRAGNAQPQNALAEHVNRVVDRQKVILIQIKAKSPRDAEISGRRDKFGIAFVGLVSNLPHKQITRDLLAEELVKWLVGVERIDDVVAIPPRMSAGKSAVSPAVSAYRTTSSQCRPHFSPYAGDASSRSINRSNASGESSARNSAAASGDGGKPVRSKVARRIRVVCRRENLSEANGVPSGPW